MADYRIYIDESGDHTYRRLEDLEKRYLGLTGVLVRQDYYDATMRPALEQLKRDHFSYDPDSPPVLVRSHLIRSRGPFWRLRDPERRAAWGNALIEFISSLDVNVYTVVMDKQAHFDRYGTASSNPYEYSLRVLLNRIRGLLVNFERGSTADVMAEARGKREDAQLLREYEEFRQHGDDRLSGAEVRAIYPDTLQFRRKDQNIAGLQIADLLAYPQKMDIVERNGRPMHAELSAFSRRLNTTVDPKIMGHYGRYLLE